MAYGHTLNKIRGRIQTYRSLKIAGIPMKCSPSDLAVQLNCEDDVGCQGSPYAGQTLCSYANTLL